MKRRLPKIATLLMILALVPLGAFSSDASSTNYVLEWHTTAGNGGGEAESTNYDVNLTVGQVATGEAQSVTYDVQIGFWYGFNLGTEIFYDGFETGDYLMWSSSTP